MVLLQNKTMEHVFDVGGDGHLFLPGLSSALSRLLLRSGPETKTSLSDIPSYGAMESKKHVDLIQLEMVHPKKSEAPTLVADVEQVLHVFCLRKFFINSWK